MLKRFVVPVVMIAIAITAIESKSHPAFAGPPIGINLAYNDDWNPENVFADAMKQSRLWSDIANANNPLPASQLDSRGWPTVDAQIIVWAGNPSDMRGSYALSFNGQATVAINNGSGSITNQTYNSTSNTTTATVISNDSGGDILSLAFTNTIRTPGGATNTGVANVRLMRPTSPGASTSFPPSQMFNPLCKALYAKFSVIRPGGLISEWGNPETNWSDRTLPDWATQQRYLNQSYAGINMGSAFEYAVTFCNWTGKDLWINVPSRATDDFVTKLAQLIRYGSDGVNPYTSPQANPVWAPLDPNLRVYVEYGNEVWNPQLITLPGYSDYVWDRDAAIAEVTGYPGGVGPLNFDHLTLARNPDGSYQSEYNWAMRRVTERSIQIGNIFRGVFGDSAMMTSVRPVLEAQEGSDTPSNEELHMAQDYYNNQSMLNSVPGSTTTAHPPSYYFYGGGGSAYYTSYTDLINPGTTDINSIWTRNEWSVPFWTTQSCRPMSNYWLTNVGRRIAYEGGPDQDVTRSAAYNAVQQAAWSDSRMTSLVTSHQTAYNDAGGDLLMYFASNTSDWRWGFVIDMNNLNTPKMAAINQINASNPPPATYGTAIPGSISASTYVYPANGSGLVDPTNMVAFGTPYYTSLGYVVNNSTASAFTIGLSAGSVGTGNIADVYVDGQLAGSITIPNTGANTTYANSGTIATTALQTGAHGLMIKARTGSFGVNSIVVGAQSGTLPAAPTGLAATGGVLQVSLNWTASPGATAYNIYRGAGIGGEGWIPIASGVTGTSYTNTGLTNGSAYYFQVTAVNSVGESVKSNESSATPGTTSYPSNLNFISSPYTYTSPLDTIFGYTGVRLAVWQPRSLAYSITPTAPADQLRLGQGYWVRLPSAVTLPVSGTPADPTQNFTMSLQSGWNQIGDPFLYSIPVGNLRFSSGSLTYAQATSSGLVRGQLWAYSTATGGYVVATTIDPGQGYWINVSSDTTVQFPHP